MAIFKYTSIKYIIAKLFRDLRLEDPNYELDIIEWCAEALAFIGAGAQFKQYVVEQTLTSFKTQLPSNLHVLDSVMYKEKTTDKPKKIDRNDKLFPDALYEDDNDVCVSYTINDQYILCSEETGTLVLTYKGVAIDEEGYPLVPDNQYYREALFWYCFKHLLMLGYNSPAGIKYDFAEQRWLFYCTAARNKANYPSIDQYEAFKNSWVSLIGNIKEYRTTSLPDYNAEQ